jgi:transcriptional regulator with XRE-family HTH domain
MKTASPTFGQRLRALRESAGLSVAQLAERIGSPRMTIHRLESGERLPGWEMVCRLAAALDVSTEKFREK